MKQSVHLPLNSSHILMARDLAGFAGSENALSWHSVRMSLVKSTKVEDEIILALAVQV